MSTKKTTTVVKPQRLTNTMRDVFVAAVMADVPKTDYETAIRDAVQKAALAAMPPAVKKLYAAEDTKRWVNTSQLHLGGRDGLPGLGYINFHELPTQNQQELKKLAAEVASDLINARCEQHGQREKLRGSLRVAADRCTTTTQLAEALPEFAKYLPQSEAEATRNLPAIANLVTEFTRAGWPKGKKTVAA